MTDDVSVTILVDAIKDFQICSLSIYPNPTTGELKISFAELAPTGAAVENGELKIVSVEVFDIYGRKLELPHCVRNDVIPSGAQRNEESQTINISHLHPGIYFVRVGFAGGGSVKKLVKQ